MRTLYCPVCSSPDVEYKADILVGCCEHKSGEVWHCKACGEDMMIQVVYSDDPQNDVDCPHEQGDGCNGCERK